MVTISVEIRSTSPYLMHRFGEEAEQSKPTRRVTMETKDPRTEAEKVVNRAKDGTLYFPATQIIGSMCEAGGSHKARGSRKSLKYIVPCAIRMATDAVTLLNGKGPAKDYEVDSRPVTIPATKGRIMRHRPRLDDWGAKFDLVINDDLLSAETVHKLLEEAGQQQGIGDFRPNRRGPFGCFRVVKFQEANK